MRYLFEGRLRLFSPVCGLKTTIVSWGGVSSLIQQKRLIGSKINHLFMTVSAMSPSPPTPTGRLTRAVNLSKAQTRCEVGHMWLVFRLFCHAYSYATTYGFF